MSARPQHTGRADLVRKALAQFPQGATIEQLRTLGRINESSHIISRTLTGLARSGQATCSRSGRIGIWRLAGHVQHAIAPLRAAETRERRTSRSLVTALPLNGRASDASTTVRHKDYERDQLAEDLAAFRARGGVIEELGTTPLRPSLSRHAANHGSYVDRMAGQCTD